MPRSCRCARTSFDEDGRGELQEWMSRLEILTCALLLMHTPAHLLNPYSYALRIQLFPRKMGGPWQPEWTWKSRTGRFQDEDLSS